jgi:hypothetical protein
MITNSLIIKQSIVNSSNKYPKVITFGIALGITFAISMVLGFVDFPQVHAMASDTSIDDYFGPVTNGWGPNHAVHCDGGAIMVTSICSGY